MNNTPQPHSIPITITERQPISFDTTNNKKPRPVLTIIGSAGVVGTVTREQLSNNFEIRGLDTATQDTQGENPWWTVGSLSDEEVLNEVIKGANYVLLTATGAKGGWAGLKNVDWTGDFLKRSPL